MSHLLKIEWLVEPIEHAEAVAFVREGHYAQGAANTSVARHGLRRRSDGELCGVTMWMPPTITAARSVAPLAPGRVLALSRLCVAPSVPTNGASFLLGKSMKRLDRDRWPILLTYADTRHGHTGAIYRATNWTYIGEVRGADAWVDADGVQRGRKRGGRNLSVAEMMELGYRRLPTMSKHKFVHGVAR